jgi:hypothetical protein
MSNDYKELPCRHCGRVWKWAFDKKSVPYCPEGYGCTIEVPSVKEMFEQVIKRLDDIEMKISQPSPYIPSPIYQTPVTPITTINRCTKCGIDWSGSMGYVCTNTQCPMQSVSSFEIEDLDPDKRSWYYDGYGVRRKK